MRHGPTKALFLIFPNILRKGCAAYWKRLSNCAIYVYDIGVNSTLLIVECRQVLLSSVIVQV